MRNRDGSGLRLTAIVVVMAGIAAFVSAGAEAASLTIEVDPAPMQIVPTGDGGAIFDCQEAAWASRSGEPKIPWRVMTVLLPPDVIPETLAVDLVEAQFEPVDGQWDVSPVPPATAWKDGRQVIFWPPGKNIVAGQDADIYGTDAFWPEANASLMGAGRLRKWRLAQVAVPLVKYNPVQSVLSRLTGGQLVVSFEQAAPNGQAPGELSDRLGESAVRRIAVNFQDQRQAYDEAAASAEGGEGAPVGGANPGYVIITTSAIESGSSKLADFVAHKETFGFDVQVITESDFGGGTGDTASENIRTWLQAHYVTDEIEYVLLIGDPNPTTGDVPMKMLWPWRYGDDPNYWYEAPSDYYYADLTGDWDRDGDGFYGEDYDDFGSGGVDRNWEVLVGRIPHYGSLTDLDAILQKTAEYHTQHGTAAAWRTDTLLPMEPSNPDTPGYHLGEAIKNQILQPAGRSYHRVYEEDYGLSPPPETYPCTVNNVTSVWSNGSFGLVVWWTHGLSQSADDVMDVAHVPSLNDAYPALTFQVSCENSYPEVTDNLSWELLKNGAVCTIGATRVSWYLPGQTVFAGSPSNAGMSYEYASRVVGTGLSASEALQDLKETLPNTLWMNFVVFNIYGDPSTRLWAPESPEISEVPDATISTAQPYTQVPILLYGSDPVTWSLVTGPTGMTIDPNNGEVTWSSPGPADSNHAVTIQADNALGSDTETWELIVLTPPVIGAVSDRNLVLGQPYAETPSLTQGSQPVTWSKSHGPTGVIVDPSTGQVTWPDPQPADATKTVTIKAENAVGEHEISWEVTVTAPPIIDAINDATIALGQPYTYAPSLQQGASLPIAWTLLDGPAGLTVDPDTGQVSWPDPGPADTVTTVEIQAENAVDVDVETWTLTVLAPPIIQQIPDRQVVVDEAYSETPVLLQGTIAPTTWSLVKGPATVVIDPSTGQLDWAAPNPPDAVQIFTVRAENSVGSHDVTWQVTVTASPIVSPVPDRVIPAGRTYRELPVLTRGMSLPITWSLQSAPPGMTIDTNNGTVSWLQPDEDEATYTITVRAENDVDAFDLSWKLDIAVVPVIQAVPDQQVVVGQLYTETPVLVQGGSYSTWELRDGPYGMTVDASSGVVRWPLPTPIGSTHTVKLRASNPAGSGDQTWQVTVVAVPTAPEIHEIDNQTIPSGVAYTGPTPWLVIGTKPVAWTLVTAPGGMAIDAATGVVSWAKPTHVGGPFAVTIRATNALGSDTEGWSLTVPAPDVQVSVGVSPASVGLKMVVDGLTYTSPQTFTWKAGTAHPVSVATSQMGSDGATYGFDSWGDGVTTASRSLVADKAAMYTALMRGVVVTLIDISGPTEVPEGESASYSLWVTRSDGSGEEVTSLATWRLSSTQYATIEDGVLSASNVDGDAFCEIHATYDREGGSLTARLPVTISNVLETYALTVSTLPASATPAVRTLHSAGETVAVAVPAAPEQGMAFVGWQGAATGTNNPLNLTMNGDKSVVAVFETPRSQTLPTTVVPTGICGTGTATSAAFCLFALVGIGRRRSARRR